jgi:hypothetical protein
MGFLSAVDEPAQLPLGERRRGDQAVGQLGGDPGEDLVVLRAVGLRWACRRRTNSSTGSAWKASTSSITRFASAEVSPVLATIRSVSSGSIDTSRRVLTPAPKCNFLPDFGQKWA